MNRNINIYQTIQNRLNVTGYYHKFILQELHAAHFEVYLGKNSFQLSKTDTEKEKIQQKKQNKTIKHLCCIWPATNIFLNQHKNVTNETFLVGHLL